MKPKIFIDSNVLIDLATRRKNVEETQKLFALIHLKEFEAFVSSSQITDVYYILSNGTLKLDQAKVIAFLKQILSEINIFPLSKTEIFSALGANSKDFEDRCVFECAKCVKTDFIITSNINDFKDFEIKCGDVIEFFSWLAKEKGLNYDIIRKI